jgi:hypothetical protein
MRFSLASEDLSRRVDGRVRAHARVTPVSLRGMAVLRPAIVAVRVRVGQWQRKDRRSARFTIGADGVRAAIVPMASQALSDPIRNFAMQVSRPSPLGIDSGPRQVPHLTRILALEEGLL